MSVLTPPPDPFLVARAWLDVAPAPARPQLLDGETERPGPPPLTPNPCRRTPPIERSASSAGPERSRDLQGSYSFRREFHRL
jgi:hypothetical protein